MVVMTTSERRMVEVIQFFKSSLLSSGLHPLPVSEPAKERGLRSINGIIAVARWWRGGSPKWVSGYHNGYIRRRGSYLRHAPPPCMGTRVQAGKGMREKGWFVSGERLRWDRY